MKSSVLPPSGKGLSRASLKRKKTSSNKTGLANALLANSSDEMSHSKKTTDKYLKGDNIENQEMETKKKKKLKTSSQEGIDSGFDRTDSSSSSRSDKATSSKKSSSTSDPSAALAQAHLAEFYQPDTSSQSLLDILHLEEPRQVVADRRANMLTSKLLSPTTRRDFYTQYWEKEPLLVERLEKEDRSLFKGLFSRKAFRSVIQDYATFYGEDVDVSRINKTGNFSFVGRVIDNNNVSLDELAAEAKTTVTAATAASGAGDAKKTAAVDGHVDAVQAKPADIWRCAEQGYAVRLLCPQKYDDVLWSFLAALEHEFGCHVGCEADLLGPGCQGYAPTLDGADSFILQVTGETWWRLWKPPAGQELPLGGSAYFPVTDPDSKDGTKKPNWDRVLQAGNTLYIPRGWGYVALNPSDKTEEPALHLRVHTNRDNSVVDLLRKVVPTALDVFAQESANARQGLPRLYASYLGVPFSETEGDARRSQFMQQTKLQLSKVLSLALGMVDAGADQMSKKFLQERLPVPLTSGEEACSAAGAPDARIFLYTRLRMLRPGIARVLVEDGMCVVYHCMDNGREMFASDLQPLEFDLDDGPTIEALLLAYPTAVSVSELPHPSEEDEDKLGVAQALFKEGFLVIDDDASKPRGAPGNESDEDSDDPF